MKQEDLYLVLGVSSDATEEHIRKAYRRLAAIWHPDRSTGHAPTFHNITTAYQTLSDPHKRRKYDRGLELPESVLDLYRHHPAGRATVELMVPAAPMAPHRGEDIVIRLCVPERILEYGGVVHVQPPAEVDVPSFTLNVPPSIRHQPWCQFPHLGKPGRNGGDSGDLWILAVSQRTPSTRTHKQRK
jgi:DnaJ-class molecular chaperone